MIKKMIDQQNINIEEELQRSKEDVADLKTYLEGMKSFLPVAIFIVSGAEVIIDINLAFEKLMKTNLIEIVGINVKNFFVEKREIKKTLDLAKKNKNPISKELTLISKKEKIPVKVFVQQRKDEEKNLIGYFFSVIDITETKLFREKLEEAVAKKTKELRERVNELEKIHRMTVGREMRMIELKEKIKELEKEILEKL